MNRQPLRRSFMLTFVVALSLACAFTPALAPTATAPPPPTDTAVPPTATLTPTTVPLTATIEPTATATTAPVNTRATRTAEAEAQVIADIAPHLERYGFSTEQGGLGWVLDEPVTLEMEKFQDAQASLEYALLSVTDFVVQADITWNSTSGLAGCGFIVRFDRFTESEYDFLTLRLSGAPVWVLWAYEDGLFSFDVAGYRESPMLDVGQGSTNRVALAGEGNRFTVWINGQEAGDASYRGSREGSVGLLSRQESGKTTCLFENAWMWILE